MRSSGGSSSGHANSRSRRASPTLSLQQLYGRTVHKLLHPARHLLARQTVCRVGTPESILFVCHGNICRSPYAAQATLRELPPGWSSLLRVDSAGFIGPDRRSPQHAVEVARDRAVELSGHRSKLLNPALINSSALVVVMDPWQRREVLWIAKRRDLAVIVLSDLQPSAGDRRTILDPVAGGRELFEQSYDQIDVTIRQLVLILTRSQS